MTDNDYIFMLYVLYVQWKLNKGGAPVETVIAVVVAIAVTAIVVYFVTSAYHKKVTEAKIGNAEEKAREIIVSGKAKKQLKEFIEETNK